MNSNEGSEHWDMPDRVFNELTCPVCGYKGVACMCNDSLSKSVPPNMSKEYVPELDETLDNLDSFSIMEKVILFKTLYDGKRLSKDSISRLNKVQRAMLPETIEKLSLRDYDTE